MEELQALLDVVIEYIKGSKVQISGARGILWVLLQNEKLRAFAIKICNVILRVLFSRITSFAIKVTKKGSLLNELLLSIQNAIITNDKEKVAEIKSEVNDIKKVPNAAIYQKPSMFAQVHKPLDVIVISKKLVLRRNLFRNIARRRRLRRTQSK